MACPNGGSKPQGDITMLLGRYLRKGEGVLVGTQKEEGNLYKSRVSRENRAGTKIGSEEDRLEDQTLKIRVTVDMTIETVPISKMTTLT